MDNLRSWKHTTNIYEVNIRQYTQEGTFRAFEKHLPRLKDMGIKTLWLMPITPISHKNKKGTLGSPYAASDYTSINPEFGNLEDFKHLVTEAHKLGFKIIIDWVANHTGWDHVWTKKHPDFYLKDPETNDFKIASGMDDIIELDYNNPEMRKAMIEAMKYWVTEADIDGFRCDLAAWVEVGFWKEARPELDVLKPLFWLGEFDELESPEYGKIFDASYVWCWMHKTRDFNEGNTSFSELKNLLHHYSEIGDASMRAWFTSNHDENTWNGTEYEKYGVLAKTLAVFSVTWDGIPLIYNGQEIPLYDKRIKFFDKDTIPWAATCELHDFYKTLLNLKSNNPALRAGDPFVKTCMVNTSDNENLLVYLRKTGKNEVLTMLNFSKSPASFKISDNRISGLYINVFNSETVDFGLQQEYHLEAGGFLVFEK